MSPARILPGISIDAYHRDVLGADMPPTLSSSIAKLLCERTPEHARLRHPRLQTPEERAESGDDDTPAKSRGTLLHKLVLGKGADIVIIDVTNKDGEPVTDFKTKAAQVARDEALAAGKIPVFPHVLQRAQKSASGIVTRLRDDWGISLDGESEVVVTWTETASDGTKVQCRGMIDHLRPRLAMGVDLKTLDSADPESCAKQVASYGHDIQAAAYRSALAKLYPDAYARGRLEFVFAFAEPGAPNTVTVAELDGMCIDMGMRRWQRAVDIWAECTRTGQWPASYAHDRIRIAAKPWRLAAEEEFAA